MKTTVGIALLSAVLFPACVELGLGGGETTSTGDTDSTGSGDSTTAAYSMTGSLQENTCGDAVDAASFQNTISMTVDGSDITISAGKTVAVGDYTNDSFDASGQTVVDLAAMTGLQGTACQLVRTDRIEGDFDGFADATFNGTLHVHYEPNDQDLCSELLVNTWDAPFRAIPCDVEYDISGTKN